MGMKDRRRRSTASTSAPAATAWLPGDFIGPNGQKFNIKGMARRQGAASPSPQPARPAKAPQ
jgi:hypothetical protein